MIKTFNKPTRCKCKNKNNKTCLNKQLKLYNLDNTYMCWLHYNYYCIKYATLIQAYYKAYKQRKLIKMYMQNYPMIYNIRFYIVLEKNIIIKKD